MSERMIKELFIYIFGGVNLILLSLRSIGAICYYFYFFGYLKTKMSIVKRKEFVNNSKKTLLNKTKLQKFFMDEEFENYR